MRSHQKGYYTTLHHVPLRFQNDTCRVENNRVVYAAVHSIACIDHDFFSSPSSAIQWYVCMHVDLLQLYYYINTYLYTVIVAANSSSTLITTFTLGATDTASSPLVELVHNVAPAAYNTTSASTLASAGYFLYLGGTRLEIFNNSADILQPLHSFLLSDCEGPRRLAAHGPGISGSSLVHIVEAIALVECKTSVYALFPDRRSDFRLQKRLDVSTDTKTSIAVLPRSDNTTIALVTRSGESIVFFSNLDGSFNPSPAFPSSITCLPSAPPLQPYGKDEVILHCPNMDPGTFALQTLVSLSLSLI